MNDSTPTEVIVGRLGDAWHCIDVEPLGDRIVRRHVCDSVNAMKAWIQPRLDAGDLTISSVMGPRWDREKFSNQVQPS